MTHWRVAQRVGRQTVNLDVAGSSPASSAKDMRGRSTPWGISGNRPSAFRADTPRDLNSSYRLPPKSILHCEDVPDSPLNIGASCFVALFFSFIAVFGAVLFAVLRAVGL